MAKNDNKINGQKKTTKQKKKEKSNFKNALTTK